MPIPFEDHDEGSGTKGSGVPLPAESFLPENEQPLEGGAKDLPLPGAGDPE